MADTSNPRQEQVAASATHPLSIYNAFPRDFANVQQLIQYLPTIAGMGCDVVWINPIQECTGPNEFYKRQSKLTGEEIQVKDSLYAMTSTDRFLPGWLRDPAELTQLTATANGLGMDIMFDLVLNHVGAHAETTRRPESRHWFHPQPEPGQTFDDARKFKYNNPNVRREAIAFWQNFISRYVVDYGFSGIRLDAVRYVHPEVQKAVIEHANECVRQLGQRKLRDINAEIAALQRSNPGLPNPELLLRQRELAQKWVEKGALVFGELLFEGDPRQETQKLLRVGLGEQYDVVTNSIYYGNTTTTSYPSRSGVYPTRDGSHQWQYEGIEKLKEWAGQEMQQKRQLTKIGTVGFTGNHDERPLALECVARMAAYRRANEGGRESFLGLVKVEGSSSYRMRTLQREIEAILSEANDPQSATGQRLTRMMKQHIATVAFASDGGYYMLSGDEYGAPWPKNVFGAGQDGRPLYPDGGGLGQHWGGRRDLTKFFQEINQTLKALPIPKEIYAFDICYPEDKMAAGKKVLNPQQESLRCIVRATGNAFDVVLVNVGNARVELKPEHLKNINQQLQQYNPELYAQYSAAYSGRKVFFHSVNGVVIPAEANLQQRIMPAREQVATAGKLDTLAAQLDLASMSLQTQQHPPVTPAFQQQGQQAGSLAAAALPQSTQGPTSAPKPPPKPKR